MADMKVTMKLELDTSEAREDLDALLEEYRVKFIQMLVDEMARKMPEIVYEDDSCSCCCEDDFRGDDDDDDSGYDYDDPRTYG
jgi:hypothetical protein